MDFILVRWRTPDGGYFGEAPAQSKSCDEEKCRPDFGRRYCENYQAADEEFWKHVYYWITPEADCGDDRGDVCKDNNEWVPAWNEIKG